MKEYIKTFETESAMTEYLADADIDVFVGYTKDDEKVHWSDAIPVPYEEQYFTIESLEDGNEIKYFDNYNIYPLSASTDNGKTWTEYKASTSGTTIATLNTGKKVLIKAIEINYAAAYNIFSWFNASKQHNVYGNAMSLIYSDDFIGKTSLKTSRQFIYLLSDNASLISAENLILPVTTLADQCYYGMFQNCTSLTTAPKLPALNLANGCYQQMFQGCTSLATAPELPATTLTDQCYEKMFSGCTSLTTAPELTALYLNYHCYNNMFNGCSNLIYIKCLATDKSGADSTTAWVEGVAASGTFIKAASMNDWSNDTSGIPYGWTVVDV